MIGFAKKKRVLVTSAWPYVHTLPHLGNLVGSILPGDVIARYFRLKGASTLYVTGSDVHGTPMEVEAFKKGVEPAELAEKNHKLVKELFEKWNIQFDNYTTTHTEWNKQTVYDFFERLWKNGYIKEGEIEQVYCKNDKRFLPDRWVEGTCPHCSGLARGDQCNDCGKLLDPKDLIDPYCIICKQKDLEFRKTQHLFIDLPKFRERIEKMLEKHKEWPDNAKNFTREFIKDLQTRPITRDLKWGFPVPLPWYKEKVFYVWFDAVLGYVSAVKEYCDKNKCNWEEWWKRKGTRIIQTLGKDNITFHTVIFPSMLMGTKARYNLPDYIASYEYLLAKGVKFSKSRGVGLNIEAALDLRPADYWRYTLIALLPEGKDTEFSLDELQRRVNNELADIVGNFVQRTLVFIGNNYNGKVPEKKRLAPEDKKMVKKYEKLVKEAEKNFEKIKLRDALGTTMKIASEANAYLNKKEPWHAVGKASAANTLYVCANIAKGLGVLLEPFVPKSAQSIWKQLGIRESVHKAGNFDLIKKFTLESGHKIGKPKPLFKKIGNEELKEWKKKLQEEVKYVNIEDFEKLDLRVAEIKSAEIVKGSDNLYKLEIDMGEEERRTIVAGIRKNYEQDELVGKQIIVIANLKPAKIKGIESKGMLLAAEEGKKVVILTPDKRLKPGSKVS
ncbi:MAG: methionine--tRNA ligase [Candidatus Aenigmatarchaeota archaeon]